VRREIEGAIDVLMATEGELGVDQLAASRWRCFAAVQALDGDTVVMVADQRGEGLHIEAVRVRTGRRAGDRTEILSGVSPGRRVIAGSAAIAKAELIKRRSPDGA
jgi:cobalt-zinc-cadmium efflux system membrane fusion protein